MRQTGLRTGHKVGLKSVLVLLVLIAAVIAQGAPRKKSKVPKVDTSSLREQAGRELHPKEQTDQTPTPAVMMPLKDNFVASKGRTWDWSLETKLTSHKIFGTRPAFSFGVNNMQELGTLTFFGLGAGFETTWLNSQWGMNAITEITNRRSNFSAPTGLSMPVQIQYFAYGLEPRWSYIFNRWLGMTASVMVQSVTISHSGLDSALATWSVQYIERAPKLAADFYLSQTSESRQRISLAAENRISEFGQNQSWSLAYGATW